MRIREAQKHKDSVADPDPGSGVFLTPWIRDLGSGMGKKSGSGPGINNPDHISESLETIFGVKILKFFDAYPGSEMEKFVSGIRDVKVLIRDKHPGSATQPKDTTDPDPEPW
jgi:hypothetical protein